jgi:hypothetical protein
MDQELTSVRDELRTIRHRIGADPDVEPKALPDGQTNGQRAEN